MKDQRIWMLLQAALQLSEAEPEIREELIRGLYFAAIIISYNQKTPRAEQQAEHQRLQNQIYRSFKNPQ